jgi:hypothetical protein
MSFILDDLTQLVTSVESGCYLWHGGDPDASISTPLSASLRMPLPPKSSIPSLIGSRT